MIHFNIFLEAIISITVRGNAKIKLYNILVNLITRQAT
jgi:hypothetical protein